MILEKMINNYHLLIQFKEKLSDKGHNFRKLSTINSQIELLEKLIKIESFNVLDELLRKTNYRLLVNIEKGHENLINIYKFPDQWFLQKIDNNREEWLNKESLIFSTERETLVFTKNKQGHRYINNKWQ